ncbi:MAG: hypothetical protein II567_02585, partial [Candidatus Riflebacteria bacterium]|nr:hypothetical protein [Candidatus Riflebacteria bacterium]
MFFKLSARLKLLLFIILFLGILCPVFAVRPALIGTPSITSSDNPARIGSQITVSVQFTSDEAGTNATTNLTGIANPGINNLRVTNLGANIYLAQDTYTVVTGTINNANPTISIILGNASGTYSVSTNVLTIDNKPPTKDGLMTCKVNGTNYTAGRILKAGDHVVLTQKITDNDTSNISVDLSPIGLGVITMTPTATARTFSADFDVPNNYELVLPCNLTITDNVGNTTTYQDADTLNLPIDSKGPNINVTVSNNAGNVVAIPGHQLAFTATIANYDGDTVRVTSTELLSNHWTAFGGLFPINLVVDGTPTAGGTATFQGTLTLPTDQTCYYDNTLTFQFTARDKAGNTTVKEATYGNIVDLGEFAHRTSKVKVFTADNKEFPVATATSKLYFYSNIVTTDTSMTTVVVDMTPVGGSTLALDYDETLGLYIGTYTNPLTAVQMDGEYVTFEVTATDRYSNTKTKTTTPPILIDNVGPVIESFDITGATGTDGSILNKDRITFTANITGANATENPVTIDLTSLDNSGLKDLTNTSGNNWQYRHIVARGTVDEPDYTFILVARDKNGNISNAELKRAVDNEPPVYITQSDIKVRQNPPYIIIGDSITTKVLLESAGDGTTVEIDLTQLGNHSKELMSSLGNEFSLSFDIATGPINNGAIFPVKITDNAGNHAIMQSTGDTFNASFTFMELDQNPPDPLDPVITLTNHTSTYDKFPDSINIKKTINFSLPYARESGVDDHATATLDVTYLCKLTDDTMKFLDANLNLLPLPTTSNLALLNEGSSLYNLTIVATESIGLEEQLNYQFTFTMYDKSGNRVVKQSNYFQKVDLNPPVINSITVGTSGSTPLKIGDTISFKINVSGNDGERPKIDLTSLNPELGTVLMDFDPVNAGIYSYNVTIATGSLDNVTASWTITVFDGCDNSVSSQTRELTIDNKPPEAISFLAIADNITNNQRINFTENSVAQVTFTLTSLEPLQVSLDLTAIGGSSSQTPVETISLPNYIYTFSTTTSETSEEFDNYSFPALITDAH